MSIFGCANDEQFLDELDDDDTGQKDYEMHYCEYHDSYYCPEIDFCNPQKLCFPAMNNCRVYRSNNGI